MAQRLDGTEIVSRAGQASQAKEIGSHFSLELELIIRSGKSALGRSHRSSVWKWDSCSLTAAHTISSGGFLVFGGSGPLPMSGPFSLPCAQAVGVGSRSPTTGPPNFHHAVAVLSNSVFSVRFLSWQMKPVLAGREDSNPVGVIRSGLGTKSKDSTKRME